ncbi:aldo/keto reductase [Microbacterium sp. Bi121]|uniref:aldo/keto reductase n=1 Tax=Microbacterium sp. Bi121 TaxID=2822348 RepID=UPI001D5D7199|nr:aldo/keto reductase [Microbacterium sp. Bi121]CAH0123193.1 General stress protein 69 [Microbacterium sp. Bi121]
MTGLTTIAPLVLGTMTFGDTTDEDGAREIIERSLEAGVTWIDTANAYSAGESESIIGRVIGDRDDVILATKVGQPHPEVGTESLLRPDVVRKSVEGSLRRLQREHVDILYLHRPDRSTPIADTLSTFAELAAEGKIGAVGISNYSAWQTLQATNVAAEVGAPPIVVGQQMYNLVARRVEEEYEEYARVASLPTMIYNPLAGGLLTGRYRFDQNADEGRFSSARTAEQYRDRYWDERFFSAVEQLTAIADDAGIPLLELALRWTISKPITQSVLLGGSKVEQVTSNIELLSRGPLGADVVAAADAVGAELRGPMPAYNR